MKNKWSFGFRKYQPSNGKPTTLEETERSYLAKLNDPHEDHQAVRRGLILVYRTMGRAAEAMYHAQEYLAHTNNVEDRAEAYFFLGQAMEHVKDFESAFRFYMQAMELEPRNKMYWYFIHNNIGFSLNQLSRYLDAEKYLREAITIDRSRANAFKNLGLSLEGQGRYSEAARSYIAAVQANATDPRALWHLEELAGRQPELFTELSDLCNQITLCRHAVVLAASGIVQNN
jgi:tetratricopeptide (TPR) repeat protein